MSDDSMQDDEPARGRVKERAPEGMLASALPQAAAIAWRALSLALVAAATIAIAAAARTLSATVDEPAHLAAGMQWLSTGEYTDDLQHPPLGRIAIAAGPYLSGIRTTNEPAIYDEGARILIGRTTSRRSSRRGVLCSSLRVWMWARRVEEVGAAVAVLHS